MTTAHIRVVLFCKGPGGDSNAFRPHADESQWWERRDALVRCVATWLLGPTSSSSSSGDATCNTQTADQQLNFSRHRELVLLFDEDQARIHMTTTTPITGSVTTMRKAMQSQPALLLPTEQTILRLWKRAAQPQNIGKTVHLEGIQCRLVVDPLARMIVRIKNSSSSSSSSGGGGGKGDATNSTTATTNRMTTTTTTTTTDIVGSKRQVLEHMQKHCSLDFLREKKLNSSADVILRKVNRDTLLKIWREYNEQQQQQKQQQKQKHTKDDTVATSSSSSSSNSQTTNPLASIFRELLQCPLHLPPNTKRVAATLHESCDEFPCFSDDHTISATNNDDPPLFLCLFLGAVRDMTEQENQLLKRVSDEQTIPLVGIRFGTVPEFTSKILSILAFHHANRVVSRSIHRLFLSSRQQQTSMHNDRSIQLPLQPTCLHVAIVVPLASTALSLELENRDRIHWCLVRVVVSTLWRSRMVSFHTSVSHMNALYLIFEDGVVVSLSEATFVGKLARQHQAAPSEHQILKALMEEIAKNDKLNCQQSDATDRTWSKKKVAKQLVNKIVKDSPVPVTCTIGVDPSAATEVTNRFYEALASVSISQLGVLLIIDMAPSLEAGNGWKTIKPTKLHRALISASQKLDISTSSQNIIPGVCQDFEAASIMALQHFCYQNRVFLRREAKNHWDRKRKHSGVSNKK